MIYHFNCTTPYCLGLTRAVFLLIAHNVWWLGDVWWHCTKFQVYNKAYCHRILPNRCYVLGGLSALNLI